MGKKTPKTVATAAKPAAAKRSKLKLALLACVPLVLAGGGYAGWTFYAAANEAHAAEGPKLPHGIDPSRVEAQKAESAPESTFTYSLALSEFLKKECGAMRVEALKVASATEAENDGALVHKSWMAAARRAETVTDISCYRMQFEIFKADARAAGGGSQTSAAKAGGH